MIREEHKTQPGLFSGDMGICLSLYLINKVVKDDEIEEIADNLLDKTIDSISSMKDISFDKGLAGIGWAINYLHMKKNIEGDIDDILYNIDAIIYKHLCGQNMNYSMNFSNGLIGLLVYFIYRIKNKSHKKGSIQHQIIIAAIRIIIDKLEEIFPSKIHLLSKELFSTMLWDYPILFYSLGEIVKCNIYKEKIGSMLVEWSYYLIELLPYSNINRLALANSLAYVNRELNIRTINSYIDILFYSVNFKNYLHEIDKKSVILNGDWFYAMFNAYEAKKLMDKRHIKYPEIGDINQLLHKYYNENAIEALRESNKKTNNCALINGYSGALLVFTIFRFIFQSSRISSIL